MAGLFPRLNHPEAEVAGRHSLSAGAAPGRRSEGIVNRQELRPGADDRVSSDQEILVLQNTSMTCSPP
jgi:hypothetical protein